MNYIAFYIGSGVLVGISIMLCHETSPFSDGGCSSYEKKRMRRLIGRVLLIAAVFCLCLGGLTQWISTPHD
jgi:hypothetical protein